MKAWRILCTRISPAPGIWFAASRGKATARAARLIQELDYRGIEWQDIRCTRAQEYDALALLPDAHRFNGVDEEYARQKLREAVKA